MNAIIKLAEGFQVKHYSKMIDLSGVTVEVAKQYSGAPAGSISVTILTDKTNTGRLNIQPKMSEFEIVEGKLNEFPNSMNASKIAYVDDRTDEEIAASINKQFKILDKMAFAVGKGVVRSLIVTGPPGVGKTFGIEKQLRRQTMLQSATQFGGNVGDPFQFVKGAITPIGLYCKLYDKRHKGDIIVFDDCDGVFQDELALNLLKAALDTSKTRTISWNAESNKLAAAGIPDQFEFEGSIIFITNLNLKDQKSRRLKPHFDALMSRSHYIDLKMYTDRDKIMRISQILENGMLLGREKEYTPEDIQEVKDFIFGNIKNLNELSLRTVLKIADLRDAFEDWKDMAMETVMEKQVPGASK